MCYNNGRMFIIGQGPSSSPKCHQCGSDLILIDEKTETFPNHFSPVVTKTYSCSNKECQENKDKETAKRIKIKEEQTIEAAKRLKIRENLHQQKKNAKIKG